MKKIGILVERQRAYGRNLCEGIVKFLDTDPGWTLAMLEWSDLDHPQGLQGYDGFIARILNDRIAAILSRTGKPVVDIYFERERPGVVTVDQNARLIGQLAARHFIEHKFSSFAFFGHEGKRYSDSRRSAFVRCLELNRFSCEVYATPPSVLRQFDDIVIRRERYLVDAERKSIVRWLNGLKKPVAVFCSHDLRAYQLNNICREEGVKVPGEVAILGVDNDTLLCNFTEPTLSSIDPNAEGIGFAAAQALHALMAGSAPDGKLRIPPRGVIERPSTRIYPIDPPWISDALVFIRTNVAHKLTAADVFRHLGKSHTLVDEAFRRTLGTTVQKEIAAARIAEACRLLKETTLDLTRVAHMSGFATVQYFNQRFKAAKGVCPGQWRGVAS